MTSQIPFFENRASKSVVAHSSALALLRDDQSTSLLARNLEVLSEATGGTAQLRHLVLEFSIRGALVPQRSLEGDGRAAILRARRHEADLVSKGQLRRRAPHAPVGTDEQPFSIPPSWEWVRFGELGDWGAGATPARGNGRYYGGTMPWFKSGELNDGYVNDSEEHVTDLALQQCSLRVNQPGDVLIAMYGATIGKVALARSTCTTNQAVCACTCFDGVDNEFLLRVLKAFKHRFVEQGAGGAQPNISRVKIVETPCPLPPLAEQKRIVTRVDQLMALIDDLEAKQAKKRDLSTRFTKASLGALTTAESREEFGTAWKRVVEHFPTVVDTGEKVSELRKAICELAVRGELGTRSSVDVTSEVTCTKAPSNGGKLHSSMAYQNALSAERPFAVPQGWSWAQVRDTYDVVGGIQKTPQRAPKKNHYPYLRVENVQRNRLNLDRIERFELQDGELDRWRLLPGDLLVVEGNGSESEIGRCALWNGAIDECVHQNHLIRCRPVGPTWSPFLLLFLNSPSGAAEMRKLAITTSGLYSLSVGKIRGIWWPVPPLAEQKRIVAKVEYLMKLCDALEASLRRVEARASKLVEAVVKEMVA